MKHSHRVDKLAKVLAYMLGRRPDEFGLVPDANGYVKIKDLLKALAEESGWGYVRMNHLHEVTVASQLSPVELTDNLIRAVDRSSLISPEIQKNCPKLLYYPIRRRAYPNVLEKGLPPDDHGNRITLAIDAVMASRLGQRIDPTPVVLIVNSAKALSKGATIWRFGRQLFLSDRLPVDSFSGPPLPKNRPEPKKVEKTESRPVPTTPGSYLLELSASPKPENRSQRSSRKRKNEWKRDRKRKYRDKGFD